MNDKYLTPEEAGTRLGLGVQSVMKLAKRFDLGKTKLTSRTVRFSEAKINEYLQRCHVKPAAGVEAS
jgi:excisionase family DNA binding protein